MPPIPRILRPAFDGFCRVGSVCKLERIAIDDSVISQPERWCGPRDQDELHDSRSRDPECGHFLPGYVAGEQAENYDRCCNRRRQTQAALRERLRIPAHGLAEIEDRPDEESQI